MWWQLFVGTHKPKEGRMRPVTNAPFWKPQGGLWTSTLVGEAGSAWVDFCAAEMPHRIGPDQRRYILKPDPAANLITICTPNEALALHKLYGGHSPTSFIRWLDFEAIKRAGYDGIHSLLDHDETSDPGCPLYHWDVECTFWFHWRFREVTNVRISKQSRAIAADAGLGW